MAVPFYPPFVQLRDAIRAFADAELAPQAGVIDATNNFEDIRVRMYILFFLFFTTAGPLSFLVLSLISPRT